MGYDYVVLFAESYNLLKELKRCREFRWACVGS